ncbi:MAG: redox-regulated ATPase YchF [Pseudomonadota bacterium]|nr:redox-regulated ATPase YchF [Pseudomonadota bacterium]
MGVKCGIVGLPNVGKSSLFNALTNSEIAAENYPFCTIEPNSGVVPVPDPRLDKLSLIVGSARLIPATMEFTDIAGLVRGASKGQGLGNKFLAHIRETEAILHVVRCFEDDNVTHVSGRIDPLDDVDVVETELALADLETCTKAAEKASKNAKTGDKDALNKLSKLEELISILGRGEMLRTLTFDESTMLIINELGLITSKPVLFVANIGEKKIASDCYRQVLSDYAKSTNAEFLSVCAYIESQLIALLPQERKEYLLELGLEEPSLNRLVRSAFALLNLQNFFTAGPKETKAWTIPVGTTAPAAAGRIHGDFERGFIRAEVVGYDDYIKCGGEGGAKDSGKLRSEGKEYVIKDGDIVHFRFNV